MPNSNPVCLVVDDTIMDRRMMSRILEQQYPEPRIVTAATIAEARFALNREDVALLFLDNRLPDGLGADFLAEFSRNAAWRRVPVIMVSDWPSPFMFDKARAANVLAIWSKDDFNYDRVRRIFRTHARLH